VPSSEELGTAPQATSSARTKEKPDNASSQPPWYRIAWAALAIVLYLAIADAAVETFLRDSPLRWWISGAAVLYLAICAAVWRLMPKLWRRLNWASQAALSLLVLLALMSATAWMPGGLEQGLNLLGQPTSIVLAVLSAVVVALSGVFLARLHFIPLAGKIVVGLLACYGVFAFVFAIGANTPYSSLFHGESQWTRLPFWLQGATVGGLFLVPLALLLEIVTGLRQVTRDKISDFAFRVVALGMSLVITVAAIRVPADYDSGAVETPPWLSESHEEPLQQGEAGYQQASEKLNRLYAGLDVLNSKIDRSLFEIDALADRLGSDPAAMFHFVRDEIRYEPYTGVLRGALGTLLCRVGNSLDRSLLLAALLEKAGFRTQIASGQLNTQRAQLLVSRLFEPVKPVSSAISSLAELAPDLSRAVGTDQAKLLESAGAAQEYGNKQEKELANYVNGETGLLSNLLGDAGVDAGVITPNDQLLAEASEHYWVQYQNPDGQWVDLDSAFTDAEPGKTAAAAANTFVPDSLPEELYHHLQITLTLRVAPVTDGKDGTASDTVLLDQELRVAEQQGKNVMLANAPVPASDLTNPAVDLANLFTSAKAYQAVLQIGSQVTTGKYFDLDGQVFDTLGGPVGDVVTNAGSIGKSVGGLTGGINGAFGGGPPEGTSSRIVGEWVNYRLTSPGIHGEQPSAHDYRREIIPPAAVLSWSADSPESPQTVPTSLGKDALRERLMWSVELLPVTGRVAPEYLTYLRIKSLLDNRMAIDSWMRIAYQLPGSQLPSSPAFPPPLFNLALSAATASSAASLINAQFPSIRSYLGRPGLIAHEFGCFDADGSCTSGESFDIVAYPPRAVASSTSDAETARRDSARVHIMVGVLVTRIEWALLHYNRRGLKADVRNTTEVFRIARKQGVSLATLRPGAEGQRSLAGLSLPSSVKSEMSASLAAGNALVVPAKLLRVDGESRIAWWQLNEKSGELIGIMPGSRGQGMVEYAVLIGKFILGVTPGVLFCMVQYLGKSPNHFSCCLVTALVGSILGFLAGAWDFGLFSDAAFFFGTWFSSIFGLFNPCGGGEPPGCCGGGGGVRG
jgi:hypothetical protein